MEAPVLLIDRAGPVATLTLNRPARKNALNPALVGALHEAVIEVARDATIRAVVLTGAGGAFCSGADLKARLSGEASEDVGASLDRLHEVIRGIVSAPQPFVAAV